MKKLLTHDRLDNYNNDNNVTQTKIHNTCGLGAIISKEQIDSIKFNNKIMLQIYIYRINSLKIHSNLRINFYHFHF